ncbi:hypothetical protein SmJEL517_g04421 [Synchytrium microbalum]|uniref:Cyclic nucleotide-binding domain-containing protein n=1 Tax=Synchytrium microbalum TaxID=1806994 RepID=A0A507C373_9FUNG|nr:uncharacterized protein SmJEL517_g04421 [Synchytrium microbalum]TPX32396.1 hypothetical protein SmJEL517_g04421 [Synchytrium microbalum]
MSARGESLDITSNNRNDQALSPNVGSSTSSNVSVNCRICGKPARFICGSCHDVSYCSQVCQQQDWSSHKLTCLGQQNHQHQIREPSINESAWPREAAAERVNEHGFMSRINTNWRRPANQQAQPTQSAPAEQEPPPTEEEMADDLRFYTKQIYLIIKPVVACIVLSVLWVKLTNPALGYWDSGLSTSPTYFGDIGQSLGGSGGTSGSILVTSLWAALLIIAQVVVATIVIVICFRFGWIKLLTGFLMILVLGLLGLFTWTLSTALLATFNAPLDYISMVFGIWNFAVVGLMVIFWRGPMWLQQIYLVFMSSLMAFTLTSITAWTTWILLVLLAVWDLFAVLSPCGPLRLLIQSSQQRNEPIPALLYSVAIWMMATPPDRPADSPSPTEPRFRVDENSFQMTPSSPETSPSGRSNTGLPQPPPAAYRTPAPSRPPPILDTVVNSSSRSLPGSATEDPSIDGTQTNLLDAPGSPAAQRPESDEDEEEERSGLKLGLGDFVFYSVLVARAALLDWISTLACMVAVLTGLNATIFLLAIYRKALPALPISIAFGILFFFVSSIMLVPYSSYLISAPTRYVPNTAGGASGLWLGKSDGSGEFPMVDNRQGVRDLTATIRHKMHDIQPISGENLSKKEFYDQILLQMRSLMDPELPLVSNLANFSSLLYWSLNEDQNRQINWCGFYLTGSGQHSKSKLYLGPFQGKIACTVIDIGKGVCGTAAKNLEALVVDDVHKFPGHIACDSLSESEIVIPLIVNRDGKNCVGVLDLDCLINSGFNGDDKKGLQQLSVEFVVFCLNLTMDGSDDSIPASASERTNSSTPSLPRAEATSTREYSNFNSNDPSRDGSREDGLGMHSPSAPARPRKASESRARPALALLFEAARKRNSYVASVNSRASADGMELELSNDDLGPLPSSLYSRSSSVDGAPRNYTPTASLPTNAFDKSLDPNATDRTAHPTTSSRSLIRNDVHASTHSLEDAAPTNSRPASDFQHSGSADAVSPPARRLSLTNTVPSALGSSQNNVRLRPELGPNEPEPHLSAGPTRASSKLTDSPNSSPPNTLPKAPPNRASSILKTAAAEDIPGPTTITPAPSGPTPTTTVAPTPSATVTPPRKSSDTPQKPDFMSSESLTIKPKSRVQHFIAWALARLFIITPESRFWTHWCSMINVLHVINVLVVPLIFGWTEYFINPGWVALYAIVDVIMLVDCFFQARLAFNNKYGSLIQDNQGMFYNFAVTNRGWWITLTSLPVDLCIELSSPVFTGTPTLIIPFLDVLAMGGNKNDGMQLYWRYKVWAAVRFFKVLARLPYRRLYDAEISGVAAPVSRLIKTLVILMWMGHLDACIFWFLDTFLPYGNRWIDTQNLLFYAGTTNVVPFSTQYLISYLSAVRSLVLRLREVELDAENIYVLGEFIGGILAYGTVFGNLHSIVEMLDSTAALTHAEEQHKFEMGWLRTYMREKGLVPELQKMVSAHKELQWRKSQGTDEAHLFDDIPKSVQQEIKNFLYLDLVRKPLHVLDKWFVFQKGDDGTEMFFVKTGSVEIVGPEGQIFVTLGPGSFFGEIALFEECKRTASARAKGSIELCVLTKDDFNSILRQYSVVAERIRATIAERKANEARLKAVEAEKQAAEAKRKLEEAEAESIRKAQQEGEKKPNASSTGLRSRGLLQGLTKKNQLGSQVSISTNGVSKNILPFGISRSALPGDSNSVNGSFNYLRPTINRAVQPSSMGRESAGTSRRNSHSVVGSVASLPRAEGRNVSIISGHGIPFQTSNAEPIPVPASTSSSTPSGSVHHLPASVSRTLNNAIHGLADMISHPHVAAHRASAEAGTSSSAHGSMNGLPLTAPLRSHSASDVVPLPAHLMNSQLPRDSIGSARSHTLTISRLRETAGPISPLKSGSSRSITGTGSPTPSVAAGKRTNSSLLSRNPSLMSRNPSGLSNVSVNNKSPTPPTDSANALPIAGITGTFTAGILAATSRRSSLIPPSNIPPDINNLSIGGLPIINLRAPSTAEAESESPSPERQNDNLTPLGSSNSVSSHARCVSALSNGSSRSSVSVRSTLDPKAWVHLATVKPNGRPASRMVVFRGFYQLTTAETQRTDASDIEKLSSLLVFTTDSRSAKVVEISKMNEVEISWYSIAHANMYFSETREQFRISGRIHLITSPLSSIPSNPPSWSTTTKQDWEASRLSIWNSLSPGMRSSFSWGKPSEKYDEKAGASWITSLPATATTPTAVEQGACKNFSLMLLQVDAADHVNLFTSPTTRTQYQVDDGGVWKATRVNP